MAAESLTDAHWMQHALKIAMRGTGRVSPNPRVGCVIVHNNVAIAEGWHDEFGGPHAEVHALTQVHNIPESTTMYVTLEPCAHTGKRGPCTEAIIASGIRRVVIGMTDPYPEVSGRGIEQLRAAGIEVVNNVCFDDCLWANRFFVHHVGTHLPWTILKVAQSLDGCIAPPKGGARWITSTGSRIKVHELRGEVDAVMTGIGTVTVDDPLLTVRDAPGRNPKRIVLDSELRTSPESNVVRTTVEAALFIFCSEQASTSEAAEVLRANGATVVGVPSSAGGLDVHEVMRYCGQTLQISSVLVEAGGTLAAALLQAQLVHELRLHTAPVLLGNGMRWNNWQTSTVLDAPRWELHDVEFVDGDIHSTYLHLRA